MQGSKHLHNLTSNRKNYVQLNYLEIQKSVKY